VAAAVRAAEPMRCAAADRTAAEGSGARRSRKRHHYPFPASPPPSSRLAAPGAAASHLLSLLVPLPPSTPHAPSSETARAARSPHPAPRTGAAGSATRRGAAGRPHVHLLLTCSNHPRRPLFLATTTAPRYRVSAAANAPESLEGYDGAGSVGGVLVLLCARGVSTRRDAGGYS